MGKKKWLFKCDCGGATVVTGSLVKSGKVKSCGCLIYSKISDNELKKRLIKFIKKNKRPPTFNEIKNNKKIFILDQRQIFKRIGNYSNLIKKNRLKVNKVGRTHIFKDDYFEKINNSNKAYYLGYLFTDGHIRPGPHYSTNLTLNEKDKLILLKFKKELGFKGNLRYSSGEKSKIQRSPQYSINLGSKRMYNSLKKFGLSGNKTKTIQFPNQKLIKKNLIKDFIRGVFDGDGSSSKKNGQISFVSGSKSFLLGLKKTLSNYGIKRTNLKLRYNSFYVLTILSSAYSTGKGWEKAKKILKKNFIACSNTLIFYKLIYPRKKNLIFLERKKQTIEKILLKFNSNISIPQLLQKKLIVI